MDVQEMQKAALCTWRYRFQHRANPLHVYCRLMDLGMGRYLSRKLCTLYERYLYPQGRREWKSD